MSGHVESAIHAGRYVVFAGHPTLLAIVAALVRLPFQIMEETIDLKLLPAAQATIIDPLT